MNMKLKESQIRDLIREELETVNSVEKLKQAHALVQEVAQSMQKGSMSQVAVARALGHLNTAISAVSNVSNTSVPQK
jgi:hypothetical protein